MDSELIKLIKNERPTGRMGNNNEPVWNAEKVYDLMVKAQEQVKSVDLAEVGGSLPSNGEIEAYAMYQCGGCSPESCDERAGIITGAKWMRQKLIKLLKQ